MPASIKGSANHRQTPLFLSDMSSSAVVSTGGIFARLSCRILLRCSENPFKPALKIVRDDAAVTLECRDVCPAPRYRYARLRDYARLGAMLANDGAWNGRHYLRVLSSGSHRFPRAPGTPCRIWLSVLDLAGHIAAVRDARLIRPDDAGTPRQALGAGTDRCDQIHSEQRAKLDLARTLRSMASLDRRDARRQSRRKVSITTVRQRFDFGPALSAAQQIRSRPWARVLSMT